MLTILSKNVDYFFNRIELSYTKSILFLYFLFGFLCFSFAISKHDFLEMSFHSKYVAINFFISGPSRSSSLLNSFAFRSTTNQKSIVIAT